MKITNYHIEKYGNLYGKIGKVHTVGKSFIFINIPNIPVIQQRAESNLELVENRERQEAKKGILIKFQLEE